MQIYFHNCFCSYLPRVPILVEGTVCIYIYIYKSDDKIILLQHDSTFLFTVEYFF